MEREKEHIELENQMFRTWVTELETRKHELIRALRMIQGIHDLKEIHRVAERALNPPKLRNELKRKDDEE